MTGSTAMIAGTTGGAKVSADRRPRTGGGAIQGFFPTLGEIRAVGSQGARVSPQSASMTADADLSGDAPHGPSSVPPGPMGNICANGGAIRSADGICSDPTTPRGRQKSAARHRRTGGGVKKSRAQVRETFFGTEPMQPDPDHLVGCREIGKALGLPRAATMQLIQRADIHTILIGHTRCAKRAEVARYLADQTNADTWDGEGGALGPDRVERTWTESSWTRRRGRERS